MTNSATEIQVTRKEFFEAEPTRMDAGILVNGLIKEFKALTGSMLAVDSLSFKV